MIQFVRASKTLVARHAAEMKEVAVVLAGCSAIIPSSVCASVENENSEIKTAFLQLLFGSLKPDSGRVVADKTRLSPVINLRGGAGLLLPMLTVKENIHFQARFAHLSARRMVDFVTSFCDAADP